jgi:hypothetical protein
MAKKKSSKRTGPKEKYPWDKWFNGLKHNIIKGVDFTNTERAFTAWAYSVARARNVKVSIKTIEGGFSIQALTDRNSIAARKIRTKR